VSATHHEVRLSDHPRALRSIESVRGGAAVAAFALCGLLSLRAGLPPFDAGLRALGTGIVTFIVVWTLAVQVWRHLAVAELQAARRLAMERRAAAAGAPRSDG